MRRLLLGLVLLAGCSAGPPDEHRPAPCACRSGVCVCPHCKPGPVPPDGCPCFEREKPK